MPRDPDSGMFAALRNRNYRLWASGQIVSLVGTWMQRIAQDWLVLTLSDGNALAVGIVMALQFGPTLFLSVWGGVLADRYDKRRILIFTQWASAVCALVLGLLDVGGLVALWHVFLIAFALGCVSALDAPVRQSFTIEMVGKEHLSNAISGVLINLIGTGWVFLLNVATFGGVLIALYLMNKKELIPSEPAPRTKGQVRDGFRYVWGRKDLRVIMVSVFMVSTFGLNFAISLAVMARNTFGLEADGYGLLSTTLAVGTLAGAVYAARRKEAPRLRTFLGAAVAFGVFEVAVGLMPTYALVALMLIPTGALTLTFTTSAMNILQMSVPSEMRGRVMGIYMLSFLGGTPLGSPLLGWLADSVDPRAPLIVGGVISLVSGTVAGVYLLRSEGLKLRLARPEDGGRLPVFVLRPVIVCDATEQAVEASRAP